MSRSLGTNYNRKACMGCLAGQTDQEVFKHKSNLHFLVLQLGNMVNVQPNLVHDQSNTVYGGFVDMVSFEKQ